MTWNSSNEKWVKADPEVLVGKTISYFEVIEKASHDMEDHRELYDEGLFWDEAVYIAFTDGTAVFVEANQGHGYGNIAVKIGDSGVRKNKALKRPRVKCPVCENVLSGVAVLVGICEDCSGLTYNFTEEEYLVYTIEAKRKGR